MLLKCIGAMAVVAAIAPACARVSDRGAAPTGEAEVSIRLYSAGEELVLPADDPGAVELRERCLEQLGTAESVLRLAVDARTIRELKRDEDAVELRFSEPREVVVLSGRRTLSVRAILIPLSGELAGEVSTIFYASDTTYSSGPLRNGRGTGELGEIFERFWQARP